MDRNLGNACQILQKAVPEIIEDFEGDHPDLILKPISVLRTLEEQQALYAQGRTTPGNIVTKADGIRHRSRHQSQLLHGELAAHAVDLGVFKSDGSYVSEASAYADLPILANVTGVRSGQSWGDLPHLECQV